MSDRNITHKSDKMESYTDRQYRYQLTKLCNNYNMHDRYLAELMLYKCFEDLINNHKNSETLYRIYCVMYFLLTLESSRMKKSIPKEEKKSNFNWYYSLIKLKESFEYAMHEQAVVWLMNLIRCDLVVGNCNYYMGNIRYKAIQFAKTYFIKDDFNMEKFNALRSQYLRGIE